jgi:methyl-accepting chemotaxis protein
MKQLETLRNITKHLLYISKEAYIEAMNIRAIGNSIVCEESIKLSNIIIEETDKLETLISQKLAEEQIINSLEAINGMTEQIDLLILNGKIEAERAGDKRFTLVYEEMQNIKKEMIDEIEKIKEVLIGPDATTQVEKLFNSLNKMTERLNLLTLNNSVEIARGANPGALLLITQEMKEIATTIMNVSKELEKITKNKLIIEKE